MFITDGVEGNSGHDDSVIHFPVITVKSTRRENCNTFNLIAMEKLGTLRTPLGSSIQLNDVLFVINISDQGRSTVRNALEWSPERLFSDTEVSSSVYYLKVSI